MSLMLAVEAQARLIALGTAPDSALSLWAAEYAAPVPEVLIGYRRPTGAEGWPFVALVPSRDARNLVTGRSAEAAIAIACGYRLPSAERGAADGLRAVDALAEAVLDGLRMPWRPVWLGREWHAASAERVDAVTTHPIYELELLVQLRTDRG